MSLREPDISVVIPSIGRATLRRALESIQCQRGDVDIESIVVLDAEEADVTAELSDVLGLADAVLFTGGRKGAPTARNLGTDAARGRWVAYLDDDDIWLADKAFQQLSMGEAILANGGVPIMSCRVLMRSAADSGAVTVPRVTFADGMRVEDYLFSRRMPSLERASIFTSSLLAPRSLAKSVRWRVELKRHQDWDWVLRAVRHGGSLHQLSEPLVEIALGSPQSISATSDWMSSLAWVEEVGGRWNRETVADFIVAQPLRYALQSRSAAGVMRSLSALFGTRRLPSVKATVFGFSGILSRRTAERLARRVKGIAS